MSPDAMMIMQLVMFALLGGATFLLVWSLAGFLAKKPSKMERDIRDVKELLERLLDRLDGWRVSPARGRRALKVGDEALAGSQAQARTGFSRQRDWYVGTVFVHGEWWKAISDTPVAFGQECVVYGREGLTLVVRQTVTATFET